MDGFTFLHGIKLYLDKYFKDSEFVKKFLFFHGFLPNSCFWDFVVMSRKWLLKTITNVV